MAKKRPNVIPIIEDARHPAKYRMLVPMVDVVFADVAQPDQASAGVLLFEAPSPQCPVSRGLCDHISPFLQLQILLRARLIIIYRFD